MFSRDGFVRVPGALEPDFCASVVTDAFARLQLDDADPATWPTGRHHLAVTRNWRLDEVAPQAAATAEELLGGRDRIAFAGIQDNLIVNLPDPGAAWFAPEDVEASGAGWHKDGDWFRHFLDSPEQGMLGIVFWRDVTERQGPTYVAVDSVAPVAQLLADHPEGLDPSDLSAPVRRILAGCCDFRALTGRQGDVVLAHPFLLHTASVNQLAAPRVISNSSVMLHEPMRFDRPGGACSPLERSILDALGVDHLDFQPTGDRAAVVSERQRRWEAEARS